MRRLFFYLGVDVDVGVGVDGGHFFLNIVYTSCLGVYITAYEKMRKPIILWV